MTRVARLFLVALFVAAAAKATAADWRRYHNARFGFAIDYPADMLIMQPPPANDDGRAFRSRDWRIVATASASFNVLNETIAQRYRAALKKRGSARITLKRLGRDFYAISGRDKVGIFYDYVVMAMKGGAQVIGQFSISYPAAANARFGPVVTRMQKSFSESFRRLPLAQ